MNPLPAVDRLYISTSKKPQGFDSSLSSSGAHAFLARYLSLLPERGGRRFPHRQESQVSLQFRRFFVLIALWAYISAVDKHVQTILYMKNNIF